MHFVKLRISGENLNLQEITDNLNIKPTKAYKKGDVYTDTKRNRTVVYEEDCWIAETETAENETLEKAIERFVSGFVPTADYFKTLSEKNEVTLWVSAYPDDYQCNVSLSSKTIKMLNKMNISVDFQILFLKDLYEGNY